MKQNRHFSDLLHRITTEIFAPPLDPSAMPGRLYDIGWAATSLFKPVVLCGWPLTMLTKQHGIEGDAAPRLWVTGYHRNLHSHTALRRYSLALICRLGIQRK